MSDVVYLFRKECVFISDSGDRVLNGVEVKSDYNPEERDTRERIESKERGFYSGTREFEVSRIDSTDLTT